VGVCTTDTCASVYVHARALVTLSVKRRESVSRTRPRDARRRSGTQIRRRAPPGSENANIKSRAKFVPSRHYQSPSRVRRSLRPIAGRGQTVPANSPHLAGYSRERLSTDIDGRFFVSVFVPGPFTVRKQYIDVTFECLAKNIRETIVKRTTYITRVKCSGYTREPTIKVGRGRVWRAESNPRHDGNGTILDQWDGVQTTAGRRRSRKSSRAVNGKEPSST